MNMVRKARAPAGFGSAAMGLSAMRGNGGRGVSGGRAEIGEYDAGLMWSALMLLVIGTVMVYSASISTMSSTATGRP